jgi:hypothetical protein
MRNARMYVVNLMIIFYGGAVRLIDVLHTGHYLVLSPKPWPYRNIISPHYIREYDLKRWCCQCS